MTDRIYTLTTNHPSFDELMAGTTPELISAARQVWDALDFASKRNLLNCDTGRIFTRAELKIVPALTYLSCYRGGTPGYQLNPEGLLVRKVGWSLYRDPRYWPQQVRLHKLEEARKCGALTQEQHDKALAQLRGE